MIDNADKLNTAVLPVPLWLYTITSLPYIIGTIALCYTAEGLLKPKA